MAIGPLTHSTLNLATCAASDLLNNLIRVNGFGGGDEPRVTQLYRDLTASFADQSILVYSNTITNTSHGSNTTCPTHTTIGLGKYRGQITYRRKLRERNKERRLKPDMKELLMLFCEEIRTRQTKFIETGGNQMHRRRRSVLFRISSVISTAS